MKCCIVGGGLTGLVAALSLSAEHEVVLYEGRPVLGGCLSSIDRGTYTIESFYHHCFEGDARLFSLLERLGIRDELEWLTGTTGYFVDGRAYPLSTLAEIVAYPHLSTLDKARLAWLMLRAGRFDRTALDDVTARSFILDHLGRSVYASFFEPLLRSKFGPMQDRVSAAWLISRIAIRSNRSSGGEKLGYLRHGYASLVEGLRTAVEANGCTIATGAPVEAMERDGASWNVRGERFDTVIATIPPQHVAAMTGLPLPTVPYQGAACMTLALDREVTNGIYWLNMKDEAPYGAVVAHTNFVPVERYGEHLVYLASYFSGELPNGHGNRMLDDFCGRFGVARDEVRWHHLEVDPFAGPVYETGYRRLIPGYAQDGLFVAGMFSEPNYPERSMEGSIVAGEEVADAAGRAARHG
jgi:protoporphyrinogen oxidase